jgi:hypothetical protein
LIAVLEGHDAVRDDYHEAVWLSAEVPQQVRAGQVPEAVTRAFPGTRSFLEEFFPGQTDEVMRGAAALERVSAIERAEPGTTEIRTLAAYVEALGGRLDIVADFGRDRIVLR